MTGGKSRAMKKYNLSNRFFWYVYETKIVNKTIYLIE